MKLAPERIVSIPFIAGQWSLLLETLLETPRGILVSIPFIAGQWSLQGGKKWTFCFRWFQSPSLRGSGRFGERESIK